MFGVHIGKHMGGCKIRSWRPPFKTNKCFLSIFKYKFSFQQWAAGQLWHLKLTHRTWFSHGAAYIHWLVCSRIHKTSFFLNKYLQLRVENQSEVHALTIGAVLFNSLDLPTTSIFCNALVKISAYYPFQKVLLKQDYNEDRPRGVPLCPRPLHALVSSLLKIVTSTLILRNNLILTFLQMFADFLRTSSLLM